MEKKIYSLQTWLELETKAIASVAAGRLSTLVVYLNGTRRWFLTRSRDWRNYAALSGEANRNLCDMLYTHGVQTIIQPVLGYDLTDRGQNYFQMALESGLAEIASEAYRAWYRANQIRVSVYGNWSDVLFSMGLNETQAHIETVISETAAYDQRQLLIGAFADEGLDRIVKMAGECESGASLIEQYYGYRLKSVDLIIGSGQPAIWDLPLLDINKANLYFLQAPTFCMAQTDFRRIMYDHLFVRVSDETIFDDLDSSNWYPPEIVGLGYQSKQGWTSK